MFTRSLTTTASVAALGVLTACASAPSSPGSYEPYATPAASPAARPVPSSDHGVVRAVELVPVASRPSGAGAILGAIVGGVVGNQFGSGTGRAATTIGGAAAGALAGNAVEKRTRREDEVYRVSVRFEDGSVRDFDYQRVDDLRVGDRVQLVNGQLHYAR